MASENLYWLFSSSAQSISAFVALLLAGFALVHSMMDAAQQKDETLEDIHLQLKRQYYKQLRLIAILTAVAILGSLALVYLNPYLFKGKSLLIIIISLIDTAVIITGIYFAIFIIDPDKYSKAAKKLIQEDEKHLELKGSKVSGDEFFHKFINFESELRDFLETKKIQTEGPRGSTASPSFRDMVTTLHHSEIIDSTLLDELLIINKYRNLVFHGHIKEVDQAMVARLDTAIEMTRAILRKYRSKRKRR